MATIVLHVADDVKTVLECLKGITVDDISSDRIHRQLEIKRNSLQQIRDYNPELLSDNTEEYEIRIWKPDVARLCEELKKKYIEERTALEKLDDALNTLCRREVWND